MNHSKRIITKIIDEITVYLYSVDASQIDIAIRENNEIYTLTFTSNYNKNKRDDLTLFIQTLNQGRNTEYEEIFWQLTGLSDTADEPSLQLIAMLIDSAELTLSDEQCKLTLIRKKTLS